jgi:hypothetical protein
VKEPPKYMLQCSWVTGGVTIESWSIQHKVYQGLRFDHHLGYVCHVEPHKLKCPLSDLSHGESILDNFSEPNWGHHSDWVALEIMQELALCN